MKKIPTLFKREFVDHKVVNISSEYPSELSWVLKGEGIATEKFDGACCAIINGVFYKRYDAKRNRFGEFKQPPSEAIPCDEPDPTTGHWPHWLPVKGDAGDKWFIEAKQNAEKDGNTLVDGTYEAIGPHFQKNPYRLSEDTLIRHGSAEINLTDRSFEGIRAYLSNHSIEGIVFWKDDEPRCKIKRKDFGFKWPDEEKKAKYYIFEIEMPEEYEMQLRNIAEKESITIDELTSAGLRYMIEHTEDVIRWKLEQNSLPDNIKEMIQRIKLNSIYPVYENETEVIARNRAMSMESKSVLKLHEISLKEFVDHIDEENFFQLFGNPVIINSDNGQRLVCMAWSMAERLLRMTGRGDEADEVIRRAAEMEGE